MSTPIDGQGDMKSKSTGMLRNVTSDARSVEAALLLHTGVPETNGTPILWLRNGSLLVTVCFGCLRVCLDDQWAAFVTRYARARGYFDLPELTLICAVATRERTSQLGGVARAYGLLPHMDLTRC